MFAIREVAPGRLQIREGGGCLTLFGLPFFATGIWMLLSSLGIVTMHSDGEPVTRAALVLMGSLFTLVGSVLSFGRSITTIDVAQHAVIQQWRLLVPIRTWTYQLAPYTAVTLAFVRGDSDTAARYPIALKGNAVAPLTLCSPTSFAEARRCAAAVARHLGLDIEDTSTDHPTTVTASGVDASLQERLRSTAPGAAVARPPVIVSEITDESGAMRIAIPMSPLSPFALMGGLFPLVIALTMLRWLGLFSGDRSSSPVEWVFAGLLVFGFGLLPAASVAGRLVRSRVGKTIVTVSTRELRVEEQGIFRRRTIAAWPAADILDVDYSSKESALVSARRHSEEQTASMRQLPVGSVAATAGAGTERVLSVLSRFVKGSGLVVKTRAGLTTVGEGLTNDEVRYLHALVRRALAGTTG